MGVGIEETKIMAMRSLVDSASSTFSFRWLQFVIVVGLCNVTLPHPCLSHTLVSFGVGAYDHLKHTIL